MAAASSFLQNRDHELQVLVEDAGDDLESLNGFYKKFKNYENVTFKTVPEGVKKKYIYNFFVMDNDSYRLEHDRAKTEAVASFGGDTQAAKHLTGIFNAIWGRSEALAPTA
ncbi:MAG: hypothetical protein OFPII_32410 [Osedax symbiont Rs1]|nr:MAG: hypothetical protein OFPII_32410 [Osedax symbiont Rs1]